MIQQPSDSSGQGDHAGVRQSVWMTTAPTEPTARLAGDMACDVCVVGAGIAGLSVAYALSREGRSVVVLDDGPVGGGQTERTTAHLAIPDDGFDRMLRVLGADKARLYTASHMSAVDMIEAIVADEQIDCDFVRLDGYLYQGEGPEAHSIEAERKAVKEIGIECEFVESAPVPRGTGPAIRFPRQGQFHVLKYLAGLVSAIERAGGRVVSGAHVRSVHSGQRPRVHVAGGASVVADAVVIATNSPIVDRVAIHTKQAAYQTYVVAFAAPIGAAPRALLWDTDDPYHYIRTQPIPGDASRERVIIGGEDHKTGQAHDQEERWRRLEAWSRERFPGLAEVTHRWSGEVFEPVDGPGFIGREPTGMENVYIATGDSGNGMTHGTIAGRLITDLILGRANPWKTLYNPARKPVAAVGEYLRENANIAAQYADWAHLPGEGRDGLAPGSGVVVREGLRPVAVYRDESGSECRMSAVCPHLGGVVRWNPGEKTWDCPCHGSRFAADGSVINGPANSGLMPLDGRAGAAPEAAASARADDEDASV